jgi:hypothetical protein
MLLMKYAIAFLLVLVACLMALAVFSVATAAPIRTPSEKLLDAVLTKKYGSKGPSSTSSSRGFYKGSGGRWYRR